MAINEKMKHPKSCDGCRAFWQSQWRYHCSLGYELKTTKKGEYKGLDIVCITPKCGECPKPLTNKELINAPRARWGEVQK